MIKFYTFYTASHKSLFDNYFFKTYPHGDIPLEVEEFPQECPTGNFREVGWKNTMRRKLELMITGVSETMGGHMVHGDCDIQFFGPIKDTLIKELEDYDFAFQQDDNAGTQCAGLFICKSSQGTLELFSSALENLDDFKDDQRAINHFLKEGGLRYKSLSQRFYTLAMDMNWIPYGGSIPPYEDYVDLDVDHLGSAIKEKDVLVHHANWTVGIKNKIKLLNFVREHR